MPAPAPAPAAPAAAPAPAPAPAPFTLARSFARPAFFCDSRMQFFLLCTRTCAFNCATVGIFFYTQMCAFCFNTIHKNSFTGFEAECIAASMHTVLTAIVP
jgi:hypothetical protein